MRERVAVRGSGRGSVLFASLLAIGLTAGSLAATPASGAASVDAFQVTAGHSHTCALVDEGGVRCWGENFHGQLGDGTTTNRTTPVAVEDLASGVVELSAGAYFTCAVLTGGGVTCWGANDKGQLGDGTTTDSPTPVDVEGIAGAVGISTGVAHACASIDGGGVMCWGYNGSGQLGDGTTTDSPTPVDVEGLTSNILAITTGAYHSCALTVDGSALCWGYNFFGQLGDGTTTDSPTPVTVDGLAPSTFTISAGASFTCAIGGEAQASCWGENTAGQLGDGTTTERHTPTDVEGLTSGALSISAGGSHTCALTMEGDVTCWGSNAFGQLGDGTTEDRLVPVEVATGAVTSVSSGSIHTCARTEVGSVKCWGNNEVGQLGDGTTTDRHGPVDVVGLGRVPPAKTSLSIKTPKKASRGKKVTVSGKLKSPVKACTKGRRVVLIRDGKEAKTATTKGSGAYSFTVKVKKKDPKKKTIVQAVFRKAPDCLPSASTKKTIKLTG